MATQATNPHPVSILESVAPRISQGAKPETADGSRLSALGLGSIGKATGALSAPVAGLIALAAIGAAGAGVGAGLGSLPGSHGLAGAPARSAAQASGDARLASAPLSVGHGAPAGRNPLALVSLARPLTRSALAGAGAALHGGTATGGAGGTATGGAPLSGASTRPEPTRRVLHSGSSVGPGGAVVIRAPSGGSQIPPDNPGQGGHGVTGPAQGGHSSNPTQPPSSAPPPSSGEGSSHPSGGSNGEAQSPPDAAQNGSPGSGQSSSGQSSSGQDGSSPASPSGTTPASPGGATPSDQSAGQNSASNSTTTTTTQSDARDHSSWQQKRHR